MMKAVNAMLYSLHANLYSVLLLLIVLFGMNMDKDLRSEGHRYFKTMLYLIMVVLLVDFFMTLIDGRAGIHFYIVQNFLGFWLFALTSLIVISWIYYISDVLWDTSKINKLFLIPAGIHILLSFLSIFTGYFFIIDESNMYHRGPLFTLHAQFLYLYFLGIIFVILKDSFKNRFTSDHIPLLTIPVFTAIGGVLQMLFYGLLTFWPFAALAVLTAYVFIQSKRVATDGLTKLYNHRAFYRQIRRLSPLASHNDQLAGIVFDIDGLNTSTIPTVIIQGIRSCRP